MYNIYQNKFLADKKKDEFKKINNLNKSIEKFNFSRDRLIYDYDKKIKKFIVEVRN